MRFLVALTLAALLSLGATSPARAAGGQTGNVNGTVVTAGATDPVAGAKVTVTSPSGSYSARTDARGFFSILGLVVDTYTLTIEAPGYDAIVLSGVTISGDQNLDLGTLRIAKALRTIGGVKARPSSNAYQPGQTTDAYTISSARITQTTGKTDTTNENDIVLAAPGVSLTNAGTPTIRGGAPTEVGFQFDGIDFAEPFNAGNGSLNRVNGLGSIQVVEGAGDATQGGVGSGVINVIPKRGSYPGGGDLDLEIGGPNFSHQAAFDYGTATRDGSLSNYFSYVGQRFVPYYGYHTTDLQAYGNTFGTSYQIENQLLDNLVFRFGHDHRQALQILYSNQDLQQYGEGGGLELAPSQQGYLSYYPTNPLSGNELIGGIIAEVYGNAALAAYPSLVALNPYTPANPNQAITGPEENVATSTRFLKFEYDNTVDPSTYLALRYYNWGQLSSQSLNYSVRPTTLPGYAVVGGSRSGVILDITRQLGSRLTIGLNGTYSLTDPIWDAYTPLTYFFTPGFIGPVTPQPNYADFLPGGYLSTYFPNGVPRIPSWGIGFHQSFFQEYGAGLRVQYEATSRLKFDVGLRNEQQYKHWYNPYNTGSPDNPFDLVPSTYSNTTNDPHVLQPRASVAYQAGSNDSFRFGYGRSAIFPDAYTAGDPFNPAGAEAFAKVPAKPGAVCGLPTYGGTFRCANYADELYWAGDELDAPDLGVAQPAIYSNYDFTYQHQFGGGYGIHLTPFYKLGTGLPAASLIQTLPGGTQLFGTTSDGFNRTSGVEFQLTTPERRYGFSGFLSMTYQNVLQSAPPLTAQEDTLPQLSPATLALGDVYRAGYVSPFSVRLGGTYALKNGFSVTPVLQYDRGFPYSVGNLIAAELGPGVYANVPQVNFGPGTTVISGYQGSSGAQLSTNYYDPSDPGSSLHPNIAATRGTPATSNNGGALWDANLEASVTFQYKVGRSTLGLAIQNLFGNAFNGTIPLINPYYQPVANGLSGPLTGINFLGPIYGTYRGAGNIPKDDYAFLNGAYILGNGVPANSAQNIYPSLGPIQPTTFTLYYQYKL
jgi:hypothetical protein